MIKYHTISKDMTKSLHFYNNDGANKSSLFWAEKILKDEKIRP